MGSPRASCFSTSTQTGPHTPVPLNSKRLRLANAILVASLGGLAPSALGQNSQTLEESAGPLEEIIVSAQRQDQSLQDVPISVQVVSGEFIENVNIVDLQELSNDLPGVTITQTTAGTSVNIRGIGSGNSPGFQQSVGTFLDGVYLGRAAQTRDAFLDVQRVEVLRGPQSTYFGNNTIGGALSVTSRSPGSEFSGNVTTTYEPNDEELTVDVAAGGPVTDTFGARLALRYYDLGGWMSNSVQDWTTGTSTTIDVPQVENVSGRLTLTYDPQENLSIVFKAALSDQEQDFNTMELFGCTEELAELIGPRRPGVGPNGGRANCNTDTWEIQGYEGDFNLNGVQGGTGTGFDSVITNLESANHSLKIAYDVGEYELISLTGFSAYENLRDIDTDGSPWDTAHVVRNEEFDQISQEFRIISPKIGKLSYLAGLYFDATDLSTYQNNRTPNIIARGEDAGQTDYDSGTGFQSFFDEDTQSYAAFAAATWEFSDRFSATLGLRYTSVDKEGALTVSNHLLEDGELGPILDCNVVMGPPCVGRVGRRDNYSINGDETFSDFNQSLDLNWTPTDDVLVYASYKNGFKAGGFDPLSLNEEIAPVTFNYDEETVDAVEVGLKSTLLDGGMEFNVAVFRSEYEDLQVSLRDPEVQAFFIENAASATSQGVEIEGRWALSESWTLGYSLSFLDAHFDEWINELTGEEVVPSGEARPFAPDYSGNLNLRYETPIGTQWRLSALLNMSFTDDYKVAQALANESTVIDAFERWGARIELAQQGSGGWSLALIGKNLTDEEVWRFAVPAPQSATGTFVAFADRGRNVSLQAKYRW